jgi:NADH-quinone oxidoreductase subunit M
VVGGAGALTAVVGALSALAQYDLGRLLSFSTASQLGLVFLTIGVGAPAAGLFLLVLHAAWKASLSLSAGALGRAVGTSDVRAMGGLALLMPRTRRAFGLAALTMAAFPVASGFYARDAVLESAHTAPGTPILPAILWAFGFAAMGLTALYAARAYYLVFRGQPPSSASVETVREGRRSVTGAAALLAAAAALAGPLLGWPALWGGAASLPDLFVAALGGAVRVDATRTTELLESAVMLASLAVVMLGWLAARACYRDRARSGAFMDYLRGRHERAFRWAHEQRGSEALYRELGTLPARDLARAAAFLDGRVLEPVAGALGRAVLGLARAARRLPCVLLLAGAVVAAAAGPAAAQGMTESQPRAPRLVVSPRSLSFGAIGEAASVSLANVGGAPLHIGSVRVIVSGQRGAGDFIVDGAGGLELAPGATARLGVTFRPSSGVPPAQVFGALLIAADDPGLLLDVPAAATGATARPRARVASVALRAGTTHLLSWLVFSPLLGVPLLLLLGGRRPGLARWIALGAAAAPLALVAVAIARFDPTYGVADGNYGLQLAEHVVWIRSLNIEYFLAVDGLSLPLLVATTLAAVVAVSTAWSGAPERQLGGYLALLLLLETATAGVLCALDAFLFYGFWALTLAPAYYLVAAWGRGDRRTGAAARIFVHGLVGALLILGALLALYARSAPAHLVDGTPAPHTFDILKWSHAGVPGAGRAIWLALFVGFATRVPLFPLHTWLPAAYAEAPTGAAVMTAGGLLPAATYGLLRLDWGVLPEATLAAAGVVAALAAFNVAYGALRAIAETDLGRLVAYASLSAVGFGLLGMAGVSSTGTAGALMQTFSHAVTATMLLVLVDVIQRRTQTRDLGELGGLATVMPRFAVLFGLGFMASLGLPGLAPFVGQALALLGTFPRFPIITLLATAALVLPASYHLVTGQRLLLGPVPESWAGALSGRDLGARETVTLIVLALLIIALGVYPAPLLEAAATSIHDLQQLLAP